MRLIELACTHCCINKQNKKTSTKYHKTPGTWSAVNTSFFYIRTDVSRFALSASGGPCGRLIIFLQHYARIGSLEAGCQKGSGPGAVRVVYITL